MIRKAMQCQVSICKLRYQHSPTKKDKYIWSLFFAGAQDAYFRGLGSGRDVREVREGDEIKLVAFIPASVMS